MYTQNPGPNTRSNSFRQVLGARYANIVFIIVGIGMIAVGVFSVIDSDRTKDWPSVQGAVEDVESRVRQDKDGGSRTDYRYVLTYSVDGTRYSARSDSSSFVSNGDTREVIYNPSNPQDMRSSRSGGWLGWLLGAVGVGLIITGIGVTLRGRM